MRVYDAMLWWYSMPVYDAMLLLYQDTRTWSEDTTSFRCYCFIPMISGLLYWDSVCCYGMLSTELGTELGVCCYGMLGTERGGGCVQEERNPMLLGTLHHINRYGPTHTLYGPTHTRYGPTHTLCMLLRTRCVCAVSVVMSFVLTAYAAMCYVRYELAMVLRAATPCTRSTIIDLSTVLRVAAYPRPVPRVV
eukprot:3171633-Rhodomonas_salina.1